MKVFLTGLSGYLGRSIAGYLLAHGYRIAGSSRRPLAMPGIEVVQAALGDRIDAEILKGSDVIIHAAHDFAPGSMAKNIEGTLAFRDAAVKAGVRQQIFLTSCSARPDAVSEYGRTKYSLEQCFSDSASVTMRFWVWSSETEDCSRGRAALLRTPIVPLIGAGDSPVALIAISHVLASTQVIVRDARAGSRNLFYDSRPTVKEFMKEVKTHAGQRPVLFRVPAGLAAAAAQAAKSIGLQIPVDPDQIRALQLNQAWLWRSDLSSLLPDRDPEFRLSYALDQLRSGQ